MAWDVSVSVFDSEKRRDGRKGGADEL